jgi:hypothetical protein
VALTVVAVILLVHCGWQLARPLLPILAVAGIGYLAARYAIGRYRRF